MDNEQKRMERAWQKSKSWITEFDGSATEAYLTNVDIGGLPQAFAALAQGSQDFRVSVISGDTEDQPQFVSPETIQNHITRLQKGQIAGLNMNYMTRLDGFDLNAHMVVHTLGQQKVDLEVVWWADQVFTEEADPYQRFQALVQYFFNLQSLFQAARLYIGPETFERPSSGSSWLEI